MTDVQRQHKICGVQKAYVIVLQGAGGSSGLPGLIGQEGPKVGDGFKHPLLAMEMNHGWHMMIPVVSVPRA